MKLSFVRGAYLNNYEGQNYNLPLNGYSSLFPLSSSVPFPVTKLPSLADLQMIPFLRKPIKYICNRTLGDSQLLWGLERNIIHSDVVHVGDPHYYYSYQTAQLKQNKLIRALVSTWWETIPFNNEGTKEKKYIKKFTMAQVDLFICHTNRSYRCLIEEGVSPDRIKQIPLGVDLKQFYPHKNRKSKPFTILFAGRLVEEKGVLDVYSAFINLVRIGYDVRLAVVGSGPLETQLKAHAHLTIERKKYEEMPQVYRSADVLCVPSKTTPSWEEQLGMVFIEAQASGLPIVTYNTGAIVEVIGKAGIIVEEGNIESLTASLIRLIESKTLREKLGTMGREQAMRLYDCKVTSKKMYSVYQSLVVVKNKI